MSNAGKRVFQYFSGFFAAIFMLAFLGGSNIAFAAGDRKPPTAPKSLAKATITSTSVKLTWTKSTDNVGVTAYSIFKDGKYYCYTTRTYITIYSLTPGTTYTFYVMAHDKAYNYSGASNKITVKTLPSSSASTTMAASSGQKKVVGYYADWAAYSGYTPSKIPAANLTHINYAFAYIDKSMKIAMGDTTVDPKNFAQLKALKSKYPSLKTLISVGGWEWSGRFSDMASTAANRGTFARSVVAFLKANGFDGVDLDWEYPVGGGQPDNSARAADKTNYTLLLRDLRTALDAQGKADGKHYLLTIAGGADQKYVSHVQMSEICKYLDWANVMTYDMHGPWDKYTDLNAPLYATADKSPQPIWSDDQAVKAWLAGGFPKSKLVMGVPFYGHLYSNVSGGGTGLYRPYKGEKTVTYDEVVSKYLPNKAYALRYGAKSQSPWLFNGSTFITYDDKKSIAAKAGYIKSSGLAGAMIWELSQNADGSLVKTICSNVK